MGKNIVLSAVVILLATLTVANEVFALSGYSYYRDITIDNTGNSNTLTDYQVLITLDTATLISAGKMQSDCDDIRFTENDGTTLLNYWIEDGTCNTANTKIWVKVPSIPASSTYTIKMWYGNSGATSGSSIDDTFIFGDDFNDGSLDTNKWVKSGTATETNGYIKLTINSGSGWIKSELAHTEDFGNDYSAHTKFMFVSGGSSTYNRGLRFDWDGITPSGESYSQIGMSSSVSTSKFTGRFRYNGDGGHGLVSSKSFDNNWHILITDVLNEYSFRQTIDDEYFGAFEYGTVNMNKLVLFISELSPSSSGEVRFDWVFVKKYTDTEPTTSVGSEQTPSTSNKPEIYIYYPKSKTYYGINNIDIVFKAVDNDNTTFELKAYLNGEEIYNNVNYNNNTNITISQNINAGGSYNLTVYADDGIDLVASERIFYVWYGVNITSNIESNIYVETASDNLTYSNVKYKEIEWSDVGNNTYADIVIYKQHFSRVGWNNILFNDSMGLLNLSGSIYPYYDFWFYDTENDEFISDWNLKLDNYEFSTSDYVISVLINETKNYVVNASSPGYDTYVSTMLLNSSEYQNKTLTTEPIKLIIRVFDENTLQRITPSRLKFYFDTYTFEISDKREYIGKVDDGGIASTDASNMYDNNIDTYARFYTNVDSDIGTDAYYGNISLKHGTDGLICVKAKSLTNDPKTKIQVKIRNLTSQSNILIGEVEASYFYNEIKAKCFNYNNTNYQYGDYSNVSIYVEKYDTASLDLYIYEIYPKEVEEHTYVLDTPEFLNKDVIMFASSDDYVGRRYYMRLTNYDSLLLNAYLLDKYSGLYYVITVVDSATSTAIENALITITKYIGGAYRTVEQIKTNADGTGTVYLEPYELYKLAIIKDGYVSGYYNYIPNNVVQSLTVRLNQTSDFLTNITTILDGVSYRITPYNNILGVKYNATEYIFNLTFSVYSANSDLSLFGLTLYCDNTSNVLYSNNITTSPGGGEITYSGDIINCSNVYTTIYIQRAGEDLFYYTKTYYLRKHYDVGIDDAITIINNEFSEDDKNMISLGIIIFFAMIGAVINIYVSGFFVILVEGILLYFGLLSYLTFVLSVLSVLAFLFIIYRLR